VSIREETTSMSIPTDQSELRDVVRARYAAAAVATTEPDASHATCCRAEGAVVTEAQRDHFGQALYDIADRDALPDTAVLASLGCGNPIAVAELHDGETVLDLGSGGGIDVLLSAKRVGPTGLAYGLDMTDEMLDLARKNQAEAGITNVQWLRGHLEDIPLPADSVDVIISNCVINLSGDKPQVLREAARVLKPGGRFAVSDVVADPDMDDATRQDMQAYTGCIAGALTHQEFTEALQSAGLTDVFITETHRVHDKAGSAIIRARKPGETTVAAPAAVSSCCSPAVQSGCCEPSAKSECCNPDQHAAGTCGCQTTTA
jgi:arsenite methyltransferase